MQWTATPDSLDLIAYDFDGVMTDNRVILRQDGLESVVCNRGDGQGVSIIRSMGIAQIILSTEVNPVVRMRADKLKIPVIHGLDNKLAALLAYLKDIGGSLERTMFVGNDVNDLDCLKAVGYPVVPLDAHPRVKLPQAFVTECSGGMGVVRELAERLYRERL